MSCWKWNKQPLRWVSRTIKRSLLAVCLRQRMAVKATEVLQKTTQARKSEPGRQRLGLVHKCWLWNLSVAGPGQSLFNQQVIVRSVDMRQRWLGDAGGEDLTVASQQVRISYLRFSVKESRKYQDAGPSGSSGVGKAAFKCRRRVDLAGVKISNRSWSRFGCAWGMIRDSGAEKIVFSTLPYAKRVNQGRTGTTFASRIAVTHSSDGEFAAPISHCGSLTLGLPHFEYQRHNRTSSVPGGTGLFCCWWE